MNNNLHILIIPSWYPEFSGDYLGSFFREQSLGLLKQKCKVGLIFPELKTLRGLKKVRIAPTLDISNDEGLITYRYLWSNWFIKQKKMQINAFRLLGHKLFKKYINDNGKPDIIHCQSIFNAGFLGEYILDNYNIPFVITEHNSGFFYKDQGFEKFNKDVKRIIKKSSECFSVSLNYSKYLTNLFDNIKDWKVHYNIVSDLFLKSPLKSPKTNKFKFICISRLSKIKNIPLIIHSFKRFNEIVPESELIIIGKGSEKFFLKKITSNLNLTNQVKFLGTKLRNEVIGEISTSHCLIYASNFETFGVIFVESLALGKPIVTTNCGSAEEIITNEVGIISKRDDEDSMVASMLEIFKEYDKYEPKFLRNYCEQNFSETKLSVKMISHYKDILNK